MNIRIESERDYQFVDQYFKQMNERCREVTKNYTISATKAASITFWQTFLYLSEIVMSKEGKSEEAYLMHPHPSMKENTTQTNNS